MTACLLLVAEDSPAALAAARYTVDLARRLSARIRVVNVIADGVLTDAVTRVSGHPDVDGRRDLAGRSVLAHVQHLARLEEVETETVRLFGDIAGSVLDEARSSRPDLIVIGRDATSPPGGEALAPWAGRIVEFAEQPVLVVPGSWRPGDRGPA